MTNTHATLQRVFGGRFWRAVVLCLLSLFVLAFGACKPAAPGDQQSAEQTAKLSYISAGDLQAKPQLLSGWYGIENGAWRWMGKEAEATLKVPEKQDANFSLQLFFPPDHMQKAGGSVTVSILINGSPFAEETYTVAGGYTLAKPVAGALKPGPVKVTIRLSRAVPPSDADKRELGAVVSAFGFQ